MILSPKRGILSTLLFFVAFPYFLSIQFSMVLALTVKGAGVSVLNGRYLAKPFSAIPAGFTATCVKARWNAQDMWNQLAASAADWYEHENGSYIYLHNEGRWWMDDPSGAGVYVCRASVGDTKVPAVGWEPLSRGEEPMPVIEHD